ncbi:uncharacterized protein LOC135196955 [Macrobrachium nipponense]|uniref:uncharacterized protein LOC135196955 n=1 Tax=Macrobrachium nipponense TaxID=159736 RepID=UPI0030C89A0E
MMNPQMQFNLSHIIGQAVDVTNYTFQHHIHGYGNINSISNINNNVSNPQAVGAQPVPVQNVEVPTVSVPPGTGVLALSYAQQQQPAPMQSYHAVFNSMTVTHVAPQVPTPQVQYFSYDSPCVTLRPHVHSQVTHQVPPTHVMNAQGSAKYNSCSLPFQNLNSVEVDSGAASTLQPETISNGSAEMNEVLVETRKKRRKEGINAKYERKTRRNRGEAYISASGKHMKAKQYIERDCSCKNKCILKLGTAEDRENVFKKFWGIGNFSQQNAYLIENVTLVPSECKKRKIPSSEAEEKNLKTMKRIYQIKLPNTNKPVRVCKSMFLSLHGVSNGRLDRVLQAVNCSLSFALQDRRGQHTPSNKTSEEDVKFVVEHIVAMRQRRQSGFGSSACTNEHGLLLTQMSSEMPVAGGKEVSVKRMYASYKMLCKEEGRPPVSLWVYRRIEKNKFSQENNNNTDTVANTDSSCDRTFVMHTPLENNARQILSVNIVNASEGTNRILNEVTHVSRKYNLMSDAGSARKPGCTIVMSREERKSKRNQGHSYYTATGKYKDEKCYLDKECGCKYRCIPKLGSLEIRKKIFSEFWSLADFSLQNAYIAAKVTIAPVVKKHDKSSEKFAKTCSRNYYVQLKESGGDVRVCKMAFLQLHGISNGRVDRVLQAVACKSPYALQDRRGHHSPKNKTREEDVEYASSHMRSFLKEYPSEAGEGPNKFCLPQDFNIQKMYLMYKEMCLQNGKIPVGCFVYRKILKERFHCHVRSPANKTPDDDLEFAFQHINSCTAVSKETPGQGKQVISPNPFSDTSVKKLHCDYITKCYEEGRKPVGIDVYRRIFNSKQK